MPPSLPRARPARTLYPPSPSPRTDRVRRGVSDVHTAPLAAPRRGSSPAEALMNKLLLLLVTLMLGLAAAAWWFSPLRRQSGEPAFAVGPAVAGALVEPVR